MAPKLFLQLMEDWSGYNPIESRDDPAYLAQLREVQDLIFGTGPQMTTLKRKFLISEAMTTSDFPNLFGDVIDRQMLTVYKPTPPTWEKYVKKSTLPDFKQGSRFAITNGDQYLAEVGEKGEYLASGRSEEEFNISITKKGRQFDISWESLVNDDLNALMDTPTRFATAAMRTENRDVVGVYAGDVGAVAANANLYEVGVNAAADVLSIASLEAAYLNMIGRTDDNGEPIMCTPRYMVVPPALALTARQILTSVHKDNIYRGDTDAGPTAISQVNTASQLGLELIVEPYLPVLDATSTNVGWYLFADPSDIVSVEMAYLQGHERPEICMKASNKVAVGGGAPISPFDGDFETDNVMYRVRLCAGAAAMDWRGTYMGGYAG